MTAAENLARWRDAMDVLDPTGRYATTAEFIEAEGAALDEAMPALLAFAEAVLRSADEHASSGHRIKPWQLRDLAEQHLGGAR